MRHLLAASLGVCLIAGIIWTLDRPAGAHALWRSLGSATRGSIDHESGQTTASAPIHTQLFTRQIAWSATPGTAARVEVARRGKVIWRGKGEAGGSGNLEFQPENPGDRLPANEAFFAAGDVVSVLREVASPITYTLADLRVAVDTGADRVFGSAPPGGVVTITVRPDPSLPAVLVRAVQADTAGHWALGLAGTADLGMSSDGWAVHADAAGHQSIAHFAALRAEVQLGSPALTGRGTLGDELRVASVSPEGAVLPTAVFQLYGFVRGSPPGLFQWQLRPLEPGTRLRLDLMSALAGASRTISVTVPVLDIVPEGGSGRVTGKAPAGAAVVVEAISPDGATFRRQTTATAAGAFSADFGAEVVFERGWRCYATVEHGGALRIRALGVISQVRLDVYTDHASGIARPGTEVSATLRDAGGALLGTAEAQARPDGQWRLSFIDVNLTENIPIDPGRMVEIDFDDSGDPLSFVAPRLSARTDVDAETVSGEAIAGARVRVTAPTDPPVTLTVEADGGGRYLADFRGRADLDPPMIGTVEVTDRGGHAYLTEWAALSLTTEVGGIGLIEGNSPAGRQVAVSLLDPAGRELATAARRTGLSFSEHEWRVGPRDLTGQRVVPEPGDLVRAVVGDDIAEMRVPELRGAIHVESDLVTGKGPPNALIEIQGPKHNDVPTAPVTTTSDAGGFFSHSFAGVLDLGFNEGVTVMASLGRHRAQHRIASPGLTLDLGAGELRGSVEPETDITVALKGAAGGTRALAKLRTNRRAEFVAALRDPAGTPVVPQPGDLVEVLAPGAEVHKAISMTVPLLEIDLEAVAARLDGRATPGGRLEVSFDEHYPIWDGRGFGSTVPQIQPDGTWRADFGRPVMFRPSARFEARYTEPGGHIALRRRTVPIVNVQHGGSNVCGLADPGTAIEVSALDAGGRTRMSGAAAAGADTRYMLALRDPIGAVLATDAGMTIRTLIEGRTVSVTLPALSIVVDWATGAAEGVGPRRADYVVSAPAFGCFGDGSEEAQLDVESGQTDDDGGFSIDALQLDPDAPGLEIAFRTREGHRYYRQVFRSFVQVFIRSHRVTGRATPLSPVAAVLLDSRGARLAQGSAVADSDGRFELRLADDDAQPVLAEAGDHLRIEASGESPEIQVEPLDFDFSPSGIEGMAPIGREVRLVLTLDDRRVMTLTRQSDDRGRWVFVPAMVPPRADWTFDQIEHVRAELETPGGHVIIAETAGEARRPTVYLPWADGAR